MNTTSASPKQPDCHFHLPSRYFSAAGSLRPHIPTETLIRQPVSLPTLRPAPSYRPSPRRASHCCHGRNRLVPVSCLALFLVCRPRSRSGVPGGGGILASSASRGAVPRAAGRRVLTIPQAASERASRVLLDAKLVRRDACGQLRDKVPRGRGCRGFRPTNRPPTRLSQGDQILRDAAELADAARRTYQAKPSPGAVWLGSRIRGAKSSCAMLRR